MQVKSFTYIKMKKYCLDLTVVSNEHISSRHVLLKLTSETALPEMHPGQFVEVRVDGSPHTFLRRPISINYVDSVHNELWLLVAAVGEGTRCLARIVKGQRLNCLFPLGHGFSSVSDIRAALGNTPQSHCRVLLVGGGVGVAPILYQGTHVLSQGGTPVFLLGARSSNDVLEMELFKKFGEVYVTTEDGSLGEKGYVTQHSILQSEHFDFIQTCGPTPMMKAVAAYARQNGIGCEASLENMMACGLGACLCCVEKTIEGNLCVCKDGPVFNITKLLW